jgi:hypothetical protein
MSHQQITKWKEWPSNKRTKPLYDAMSYRADLLLWIEARLPQTAYSAALLTRKLRLRWIKRNLAVSPVSELVRQHHDLMPESDYAALSREIIVGEQKHVGPFGLVEGRSDWWNFLPIEQWPY